MLHLSLSQYSFVSSIEEISIACDWLDKLLNTFSISSVKIFHAQVCVQEILSNIHQYGVPRCDNNNIDRKSTKKPVCKVNLAVKLSNDRLIITIVENSIPYNLLDAQIKRTHGSLETTIPGGHGIRLIRKYADSIIYSNENNENHITLEFII
jgi:anti-sigma regulatory factor (Ser/Thr protein kinase)